MPKIIVKDEILKFKYLTSLMHKELKIIRRFKHHRGFMIYEVETGFPSGSRFFNENQIKQLIEDN
jgi:hypothetical protein